MRAAMARRSFFLRAGSACLGAASVLGGSGRIGASAPESDGVSTAKKDGPRFYKSVKMGMFQEKISLVEKFRLLKEFGYDGIELNSPGGVDKLEAREASRVVGLPIHGAVNSTHWGTRLSDADSAVRQRAVESLTTAITETHFVGGSAVLLVPGKVTDPNSENQEQVWERSIEGIRQVLPLAARLGIHVLIENVWNGFCYIHDGPADQTADQLATYIDTIDSPWVGVYFDIGNHQKYGRPAEWIRTLGRRIVKLDVKDWGKEKSFCKIGDGDVDWAAVRAALTEIRFNGWATAEVRGGDRRRMAEISTRMDRALGL
jgi:L-ribulose-5-phosphate 3-epimerase